jgi:hypothetical protein
MDYKLIECIKFGLEVEASIIGGCMLLSTVIFGIIKFIDCRLPQRYKIAIFLSAVFLAIGVVAAVSCYFGG